MTRGQPVVLFNAKRFENSLLGRRIENYTERAHQVRWNCAKVSCRGDWQQHLFRAAVQTYLQDIGKLINLCNRSADMF